MKHETASENVCPSQSEWAEPICSTDRVSSESQCERSC